MIKINTILKSFGIAVFLIFALSAKATSKDQIKIAGGVMSGAYYPVAIQLCNLITKYSPITECEVVATSGSINNLNLLSSDKVDFALVQSDLAKDALKASGIFANQKPYDNLRLVLNLFPEAFSVLVKDEKGVVNFSDLSGKSLGLNLKGSGAKSGLINLLKYFKFAKEPRVTNVSDSQMASKLCDNEVDAVVLFSGHPNGIASSITSTCDTEFVSIDPLKLENLIAENLVYEKYVIPAKTYVNVARNAHTFATRAILVANSEIQSEKVNLITKLVRRYFDEFKMLYPILNSIKKEEVFSGGVIQGFE